MNQSASATFPSSVTQYSERHPELVSGSHRIIGYCGILKQVQDDATRMVQDDAPRMAAEDLNDLRHSIVDVALVTKKS